MKTKETFLPSRFWHIERNDMYKVVGRYGHQIEICINEKEMMTLMVEEAEGDRMDWTGRRDSQGDDIYELDVVKHIDTEQICVVQKICDPIRSTECMTCLVNEECLAEALPFDMSKYTRLGDSYRDKQIIPSKIK